MRFAPISEFRLRNFSAAAARPHAAGIPSLYDNLDLSFQMFLHNENFFVPLRTRKVRELDYKQVKLNVNKVDSLSYKTISANAATVTKEWVVIDATNEVLGRLASQVAKILRGKNKPSYTPHVDCGDYVIVNSAERVIPAVSVSLLRPITWPRNRRSSSRKP